MFEQAESVQRGKTATGTAGERPGCPPEHREPGMQRRPRRAHVCGDGEQRARVRGLDRVGQDQRKVDIADQRAEPAMGETAQGVGRE